MANNSIDIKKEVWDFFSKNRGALAPADMMVIVLFNMLARKCIEDDEIINESNKDAMLKFQRAYYMTNPSNFRIDELSAGIKAIAKTYRIPGYLFDSLFETRFVLNDWQNAFCQCRDFVNTLNLDPDIYADLTEALVYESTQNTPIRSNICSSSRMISSVMKILADIHDGEDVLDGTVGTGLNLIALTKNKEVRIQGQDININALQIAAMAMILSGYKDFALSEGDFTGTTFIDKFDKIIMEIPIGTKVGTLSETQLRLAMQWKCPEKTVSDSLFIANALNHMRKNGRCIINVTPSLLFSTGKMTDFKKNLIEHKLISAVISMPSLYYGTNVKTCLLVLENYHEDILMINGESFLNKGRRNEIAWNTDGIERFSEILHGRKDVPGVSFLAHYDDVKAKDFNLTPEIYLEVAEKTEQRSISEIDKDLKACYNKLYELENYKKKMKLFQ